MANHPNRARRYATVVQHFQNSGLGWERIPDDLGGMCCSDLTRAEIADLVRDRDTDSTSVTVHAGGNEAALAERGSRMIVWF